MVAEYIGEYVSDAVADLREKRYRDSRIQDYQFRVDGSLVSRFVIDHQFYSAAPHVALILNNTSCYRSLMPPFVVVTLDTLIIVAPLTVLRRLLTGKHQMST